MLPKPHPGPHRIRASLLLSLLLGLLLALPCAPALATSALSLPEQPPAQPVLDTASVLSRSAAGELNRRLEQLAQEDINAHLITLTRLDYGLSLDQLGQDVLARWQAADPERQRLLLLIDTQTNGAAVVASPGLVERLGPELLRSTARTTLTQPLRDGGRYRQAGLDALDRLSAVLQGEDDPGAPVTAEVVSPRSNVPSRETTEASKAWIWVSVLLVVGTIVPMLTWWVFSR
ncbi:MAG: TPM domain-containing protein [Cyanobacteriota bacterium]|nr:TPM domain-containing protein [Cyanobacteriota bacterium]